MGVEGPPLARLAYDVTVMRAARCMKRLAVERQLALASDDMGIGAIILELRLLTEW